MTAEPVDWLRELRPSLPRLLDRHLAGASAWLPHTYVPWSRGRDFDGPLGGTPWTAEQSRMPPAVRDALLVNLLTEDNLPAYHHELHRVLDGDENWTAWVHRWTAEEARHSDALRAYLHTTRAVDPVLLEESRMRHVSRGYAHEHPTPLHSLAYVMIQELATREAHRNTGELCADPAGRRLLGRIAADENLHMLFYRGLYADALAIAPDAAVRTLADVVCAFQMPGTTVPAFHLRALRIAAAGIYDLDVHREHVLQPLLRALGVMTLTGLGPDGEHALERIGRHLESLPGAAERVRELARRTGRARAGAAG
ncbi:acyl-ACP desaturase [Streptomyces sp. NPDC049577]|uniref:acyl-ACP desaturase n=1 Tax=Streptomyces sp. NPDC049577 TaxID=3155153 RepID=UPI003448E84B